MEEIGLDEEIDEVNELNWTEVKRSEERRSEVKQML